MLLIDVIYVFTVEQKCVIVLIYIYVILNHSGKRLYWCSTNQLGSVTLDGEDRKTLLVTQDRNIAGLAFLGGSLYYIDRISRYTQIYRETYI